MTNRMTSPCPWLSTQLYLSVVNSDPSKVFAAREEKVKPALWCRAMKQIYLFVLTTRTSGVSGSDAQLHPVADRVCVVFGDYMLRRHLLGVWRNKVAIHARAPPVAFMGKIRQGSCPASTEIEGFTGQRFNPMAVCFVRNSTVVPTGWIPVYRNNFTYLGLRRLLIKVMGMARVKLTHVRVEDWLATWLTGKGVIRM